MNPNPQKPAVVHVTASGISEFVFCPKAWKLSKSYGKLSRAELERRMADLKSAGKQSSPEFDLFQRMLTSESRMDDGTAAHSGLAREVRTGRQAGDMGLWLAAAAIALAGFAVYLFLK